MRRRVRSGATLEAQRQPVLAVTPDEIRRQRDAGWPDLHPERFCHRCGGINVRSWFVDSDRYNVAVAALGLTYTAILCPGCFVVGHELATGMACTWKLTPDPTTPFRHIEDDV